jgi:hypothetical protein
MRTKINTAELRVRCEIVYRQDEVFGFFSVWAIPPEDSLACPDDGKCVITHEEFIKLSPAQDYVLELWANPRSVNEFQCFANNQNKQYYVNTQDYFELEDLSLQTFKRNIGIDFDPNSTHIWYIDDIYEIH